MLKILNSIMSTCVKAGEKNIKDFTDADLRKAKKLARYVGLAVICIYSPMFKCRTDDEKTVEEHLRFLRRFIGITKFFDAELVRGFAFWATGSVDQYWDMFWRG